MFQAYFFPNFYIFFLNLKIKKLRKTQLLNHPLNSDLILIKNYLFCDFYYKS